jgi:hypothetical protein
VFGYALNDRVKFNRIECFVHARRSEGYFVLKDINGNTIHNSAPVKKIKLISHENSIILERISKSKNASADSSGDAEDVAVSSARLL